MGIKGVYPRWIGHGNLIRNKGIDGLIQINSFFQLGDSKKEIDLDIAPGFPNISLSSDQVIINRNYADYFGWTDLPSEQELFDENIRLTLQFDIMDMMDEDTRTQLELIMFDKTADLEHKGKTYKGLSRGERMMVFFDQRQDLTWSQFLKQNGYYDEMKAP